MTERTAMHIVSWNVASWPTALSLIVERHGSLGAFLAKHSIDVLALQEVKMQSQVIEHGLVPRPKTSEKREDLPLNVDGYESFWAPARAPPTAAGKVVTGFNGVATFASEGWTTHAERDPLRDALLDAEGRCVLTFHGDFAIFNVYIPYAGTGNERLTFKVRYLRALRDRMQKVRTDGYTVMLLGDLNVQRRLVDCHPNNRRVDVRRVLADGVAAAQTGGGEAVISEYVAAAAQLQLNWDQVKLMLGSRVAEKVTVRATHGSMERWKLFATACAPGAGSAPQRVQRGSPFQSEGEAMGEKGSDYRVRYTSNLHHSLMSRDASDRLLVFIGG